MAAGKGQSAVAAVGKQTYTMALQNMATTSEQAAVGSRLKWKAKVGSQKIKGITGMFGLGIQNKAG